MNKLETTLIILLLLTAFLLSVNMITEVDKEVDRHQNGYYKTTIKI